MPGSYGRVRNRTEGKVAGSRRSMRRTGARQRRRGEEDTRTAEIESTRPPSRRYLVTSFLPGEPQHSRKRTRSLIVARPRHKHPPRHNERLTSLIPYGVYLTALYAVICCLLLLGPWEPWGRLAVVWLVAAVALCSAVVIGRGMASPSWKDVDDSSHTATVGGSTVTKPFGALAAAVDAACSTGCCVSTCR